MSEGPQMADNEKPTLRLIRGDSITVESLMKMYTALTGKEPTPEEVEECRQILARASAHYDVVPANTCIRKSSLQPQARRFMAMLSLRGCCLSSDRVNRLSQAKFSRMCGSRRRDSSSRKIMSRTQ